MIYGVTGVEDAAVVGIPDDKWGETPVAVVVSNADDAAIKAEIIESCKHELSKFKLPRQIIVRTEPLPKTVTGKTLKRELRPWLDQRLGQ